MNLSVDTWSQDKLDAKKKEENLLLQQTSSWNIRLGLAAAATCYHQLVHSSAFKFYLVLMWYHRLM